MAKKPSTKVLKTCRIEKQYIEYCTMMGLNFNGLVNKLLKEFCRQHQRDEEFREMWEKNEIYVWYKTMPGL